MLLNAKIVSYSSCKYYTTRFLFVNKLVGRQRFELWASPCHGGVLPTELTPHL